MLKRLVVAILSLFLITFFLDVQSVSAQNIGVDNRKINYDLPYPGLLPDHPLYFLKAIRDRLQDILTLDNVKNAELYLLFSDKRANSAVALADKGRSDLAITTMSKAEKYALKIPQLLKKSNPSKDLITKVKTSNLKHKQIIEDMIKELPQGDQARITEIMRVNEAARKELSDLK